MFDELVPDSLPVWVPLVATVVFAATAGTLALLVVGVVPSLSVSAFGLIALAAAVSFVFTTVGWYEYVYSLA